MSNRLLSAKVQQHSADHHFSRPTGKMTRYDLEQYAAELNDGPFRGWFVSTDKMGRAFLDRA